MGIFYAILLTIIILGFLNVKPKISKTEGILIIILAFILALIQAGLAFFIIYNTEGILIIILAFILALIQAGLIFFIIYNFAYALVTGTLF